jgi:hypothetical protein
MNPLCLVADLLWSTAAQNSQSPAEPRQLAVRETEVEDGSLGTVTPVTSVTPTDIIGFTNRDFTCDIGIYCRRSDDDDDIPRGLRFGLARCSENKIFSYQLITVETLGVRLKSAVHFPARLLIKFHAKPTKTRIKIGYFSFIREGRPR